jgi:serine/threonine protein kinase
VTDDLSPDLIVAGRYLVESKLGAGSQGAVYRVWDLTEKRFRALKILLRAGEESCERFRREARLGRNLRHPNLVEVFEAEGTHRGRPYFVMELLNGMASLRARWPELSWRHFLDLAAQVAAALDFLAGYSLVHRDLSPDNILIARRRRVKVIDLGLAREAESRLTNTGTGDVMGSPGYLPPEQLRATDAVPKSDQWALGAIVYETLTRVPPFGHVDDDSRLAALERLADGEPLEPPQDLNPSISRDISAAVLCALALSPRERFPTSTEFISRLSSASSDGLSLPIRPRVRQR